MLFFVIRDVKLNIFRDALFVRQNKKMSPTSEGHTVYNYYYFMAFL